MLKNIYQAIQEVLKQDYDYVSKFILSNDVMNDKSRLRNLLYTPFHIPN